MDSDQLDLTVEYDLDLDLDYNVILKSQNVPEGQPVQITAGTLPYVYVELDTTRRDDVVVTLVTGAGFASEGEELAGVFEALAEVVRGTSSASKEQLEGEIID